MFYKFIKKFGKTISFLITICIVIPLISACGGEQNNGLKVSKKNQVIGVGGNINAYTTYSQAKFMEMDKNMYHSYLLSGREFILVVLPDGDTEEDANGNRKTYPDSDNYMFQAVYNGVTPYAEEIIDGNFSFVSPEYKLLIYYVLATDFLDWDKDADDQAAMKDNFVTAALDFLGPIDGDNYESYDTAYSDFTEELNNNGIGPNVIKNEDEYDLQNIVNTNKQVSECDFLEVDTFSYIIKEYLIPSKCGGEVERKNVVADVARGDSEGLTLLFSNGGLTGYFTYEQVENYNLRQHAWLNKLYGEYEGSLSSYLTQVLSESGFSSDLYYAEISNYANMTEFKFKYDLALLGRIKRIKYNTLIDINASNDIETGIISKDLTQYKDILKGSESYNNGNYVAFTSAEGFIIDRGNIMLQAAGDAIMGTNILQAMTQMDACTNRTMASYFAEVLANVGIVAGGIAVGVGAVMLTAYLVGAYANTLVGAATFGLASLSVPGVGWAIGGAVLLAAGLFALIIGATSKKAMDDTNSANFCEEYKKALESIIEIGYIKVPIYNYEIPHNGETVNLCLGSYVKDPNNPDAPEQCGRIDNNGNFVEAGTPAFKMADSSKVKELYQLTGAPSIRLYSKGRLVDEIFGAASPQFVYAIMDSWGITSANDMKYFAGIEYDENRVPNGFKLYDLLYTSEDRNNNGKVNSMSYCFSTSFRGACETESKTISSDGNGNEHANYFGDDGIKKVTTDNSLIENWQQKYEKIMAESHEEPSVQIYKDKLNNYTKYSNIVVEKGAGGKAYAMLDDEQYYITDNGINILLSNGSNEIVVEVGEGNDGGVFNHDGLNFRIMRTGETYSITCVRENLTDIMKDLRNVFVDPLASDKIEVFISDFEGKLGSGDAEGARSLVNDTLESEVLHNLIYYTYKIPIYVTINISEKFKQSDESNFDNAQNIDTVVSSLYRDMPIELKFGVNYGA